MTKILIDEATVKLALEALEMVDRDDNDRDFLFPSQCYQLDEAITALREALAQQALDKKAENARELGQDYEPAQQEPAGWRPAMSHRDHLWFNPGFPDEQTVKFWKMQGVEIEYCYTSPLLLSPGATLYTSPPAQRKPLTTQKIRKWWASENGLEDCVMSKLDDFEQVVRAIEAAHNIKENT